MAIGPSCTAKVDEIVHACESSGGNSIIVLWGVPATSKTFLAFTAAERYTGNELLVKQIQFHPGYTYEDFIEGFKPKKNGTFRPTAGVFLRWNAQALRDKNNKYVLLIEELSRANVAAVLGELLTYVEYRSRSFETPIRRRRVRVAPNLVIMATMNPLDRSAMELDDAVIRRMSIIDCPPSEEILAEMLEQSLPDKGRTEEGKEIINGLVSLFVECRKLHPKNFDEMMPFGHAVFNGVTSKVDLTRLWEQRIRRLLTRPNVPPHLFYEDIAALYPWRRGAAENSATE